jgi:uncharacterized protein YqeY
MLDRVKAEIKTSLLAGDRFRVEALKLAQAALMNARIAKTADLTEAEEVAVMQKEIKKRKEAAQMYADANSAERAENELKEAAILEVFVPAVLSGVELSRAVDDFLSSKNLKEISFAGAMQEAIAVLGNVDKSQLAGLLKTKLS